MNGIEIVLTAKVKFGWQDLNPSIQDRPALPLVKGCFRPDDSAILKAILMTSSRDRPNPMSDMFMRYETSCYSSSLVRTVDGPGVHSKLTTWLVLRLRVSYGRL